MISNSNMNRGYSPPYPLGDVARASDFFGPQRLRDFLQHAVDEAVAVGTAEALAELDRLVQHHLERRVRVRRELVGADVEDRALDRREAGERAIEMRRDQRLELGGAAAHPAQQVVEEQALLVGLVGARLLQRVAAGELPGIERLQGDFARGSLTLH